MPSGKFGKFMFQEKKDITVDQVGVDIVTNKDFGCILEEGKTESSLNPWLGPAGNEKFYSRNLFHESTQY